MSYGEEPVACLNCQMPDFPRKNAHAHLDLELDRKEAERRRAQFRLIEGNHDNA